MGNSHPMSAERFAEIRAINGPYSAMGYPVVAELLAEIERLQAENAAMRPIVEAVADACNGECESVRLRVPNDARFVEGFDELYAWHLIEQARSFLASQAVKVD